MLRRILDSIAVVSLFVLLPFTVLAQIGPVPGSGGSTVSATSLTSAITCIDAGASDAYACDLTPAPADYTAILGLPIAVKFNTLNTGAATLNINSIGAQALVAPSNNGASAALNTGAIKATSWGIVEWDGTNFQLQSNLGNGAVLNVAQSWSQNQTIGNSSNLVLGTTSLISFQTNTTQTPDGGGIWTGTTANSVHVGEFADVGFDFNNGRCGTSACTNPSVIVHSSDQTTTEYGQISVENSTGAVGLQSNLGEVRIGGNKSAITESSAQAIIRVGIPTSTNVYGMTVFYTVYDINGANYVTRTGSVKVQGGNSGGTATCTINTTQDAESEDGSQIATSNAATLTYTWTNVVSTTNCDLSLNASSSEGANTYAIVWTAVLNGNSSVITIPPQ